MQLSLLLLLGEVLNYTATSSHWIIRYVDDDKKQRMFSVVTGAKTELEHVLKSSAEIEAIIVNTPTR